MLDCQLRRRAVYPPTELQKLQSTGVPVAFAQITPAKALVATALMEGLYLGRQRPWRLEPTPVPESGSGDDGELQRALGTLLALEMQLAALHGRPPTAAEWELRAEQLRAFGLLGAQRKAWEDARALGRAVDDVLVEGGFYQALAEFIRDFTTFPYAVLKGPIAQLAPVRRRTPDGNLVTELVSRPCWRRVSPAFVWWTPGSAVVGDAIICEVMPYLPSDLERYRGQPGYDERAIATAVERFARSGWRALPRGDQPEELIGRPPDPDRSPEASLSVIEVVAVSGRVPGSLLMEFEDLVPASGEGTTRDVLDPSRTYSIDAWVVDDLVLRFVATDEPDAGPPYAFASWDPLPGSLVGRALPEILSDVQDAANATLRALLANVTIASGPQVVVEVERLANREIARTLSPWKIWHTVSDPIAGNTPPVTFYQPPLNVDSLLASLQALMLLADEVSGLPRYMGGSSSIGTLGRTASGVAMVMGHATQVMRTVARSIDDRVLAPAVEQAWRYVRRMQPTISSDLQIVVRGATQLADDDTRRARLMELLAVTSNPVDMQLLGIEGRLTILQGLVESLGLPYELIVPTASQMAVAAQMAAYARPAGSPSRPAGDGGAGAPPGPAPSRMAAGGRATARVEPDVGVVRAATTPGD